MRLFITVLLTVIGVVGYSQQVTFSTLVTVRDTTIIEAEEILTKLGYTYQPTNDTHDYDVYTFSKFSQGDYYSIMKLVYENALNLSSILVTTDRKLYNEILKDLKTNGFEHTDTYKYDGDMIHKYDKERYSIEVRSSRLEGNNEPIFTFKFINNLNMGLFYKLHPQ